MTETYSCSDLHFHAITTPCDVSKLVCHCGRRLERHADTVDHKRIARIVKRLNREKAAQAGELAAYDRAVARGATQ